jgi:choline dehydrogenase-like flavoprotein
MVPAAVGMNSTEYKGRSACIYDGWCHVGCPIGALANPLVTYLADARKSGAEVRAWSTVTRILTNTEGTRVTGVEYYDQRTGRQVQPASVVVLAAWAAQNPRILLNSATEIGLADQYRDQAVNAFVLHDGSELWVGRSASANWARVRAIPEMLAVVNSLALILSASIAR